MSTGVSQCLLHHQVHNPVQVQGSHSKLFVHPAEGGKLFHLTRQGFVGTFQEAGVFQGDGGLIGYGLQHFEVILGVSVGVLVILHSYNAYHSTSRQHRYTHPAFGGSPHRFYTQAFYFPFHVLDHKQRLFGEYDVFGKPPALLYLAPRVPKPRWLDQLTLFGDQGEFHLVLIRVVKGYVEVRNVHQPAHLAIDDFQQFRGVYYRAYGLGDFVQHREFSYALFPFLQKYGVFQGALAFGDDGFQHRQVFGRECPLELVAQGEDSRRFASKPNGHDEAR